MLIKSNSIVLTFLFLVGVFIAFPANSNGFQAKYSTYTAQVDSAIIEILNDYGICKDVKSCRDKEVILFGPEEDHLKIEIYQISDIQILNKIISTLLTTYENGMYDFSIVLESHTDNHKTNLSFFSRWFSKDIILTLKLQGK